jgi:hypothetical protein
VLVPARVLPTLLLLLALCGAGARAAELEEIYSWAVRHGSARATLTGSALTKWVNVSGVRTPVVLQVRELEKLEPAGCARLSVAGTQLEVPTSQGQRETLMVNWELDYCAPQPSRTASAGGGGGTSNNLRKKMEEYDPGPPSAQRLRNLSQLDAGSHRRKHYADKAIESDMRALGY